VQQKVSFGLIDGQEKRRDPIGWIAAIVISQIAGWLAEQFMKSDQNQ
jgi:hypothetical protein